MLYRFMLILTIIAITVTSSVLANSVNDENLNAYLTLLKNSKEEPKYRQESITEIDLISAVKLIDKFECLNSNSEITRSDYISYAEFYATLGEYANSLQLLKSAHKNTPEDTSLFYKMLEISAASNDSTLFVEQVLNITGRRNLAGMESSIDLVFKELIKRKDDKNLKFILNKTASRLNELGPVVEYWHAVTDYSAGDYDGSLTHVINIVKEAGKLNYEYKQWIINAIPKMLFLQSDYKSAQSYYQLIAINSDDDFTKKNAIKMIARINLLTGNYGAAATEKIANFAVEQELARGLLKLEENGVSYGIDNLYRN